MDRAVNRRTHTNFTSHVPRSLTQTTPTTHWVIWNCSTACCEGRARTDVSDTCLGGSGAADIPIGLRMQLHLCTCARATNYACTRATHAMSHEPQRLGVSTSAAKVSTLSSAFST